MIVVDNFLSQSEYENLYCKIMSPTFNWNFFPGVAIIPDEHYYFCNTLFNGGQIKNSHYDIVTPILNNFEHKKIMRIKVNSYPQTSSIIKHNFHTDYDRSFNGLLYYLNTNDGYTEFEDGKIVKSVCNRALFFDTFVPHRSTNCTDSKLRVTININYE